MSYELFTSTGKRKYLTLEEQARFIRAATEHERGEVRTFALTLAYSGCRISEALELTADRVDLSAGELIFRTLKQRGQTVYRAVPCPPELLDALDLVHSLRKVQKTKSRGADVPLWGWGRTQGTKHIWVIMAAAGIAGPHATPKGLRHAFGVRMAQRTRNPRLVQKFMGHKHLETTAIYLDLVGDEARAEVLGAWI